MSGGQICSLTSGKVADATSSAIFPFILILLAGSPCLKPFVHFTANHKLTTRAAVCRQQVSQDSFIQTDSKGTSHGWLYRECSKAVLFTMHSHITQIKRQLATLSSFSIKKQKQY